MSGLGFGLERIGVVALSRPALFSLLLLALTATAISFIPKVTFNGNVTSIIPRTSQTFLDFEQQKKDFRNFSRDVAIIIRSPRLMTAAGLEDLRNMQLDMAIVDGISSTLSVFSIPKIDEANGTFQQFFPASIENDSQAAELLERLTTDYPQAHNLISREQNAALLLVALDLENDNGNDAQAYAIFDTVVAEAEAAAAEDFELLYAGLTPIGITILNTLITDQVTLTLVGLLLGAIVAVIFFRCLTSAFLCAMPPTLTAIWSIGLFGLFEVPITYLTTILPTLALILAYADGIVLHHRWQQLNRRDASDKIANLREAVLRVGPASALTSITTAVAISSFALSSSEALVEFGLLGVVVVIFAFLAVIIAMPVFGIWVARFNLLRIGSAFDHKFSIGALAAKIFSERPVQISLLFLVALAPLYYAHNSLIPDYRVVDYLPRESKTLEAERFANDVFGGRSVVLLSVPVVEEGGLVSLLNRQRLGEVTDLLAGQYGEAKVFSLHSVWRDFNDGAKQDVAQRFEDELPDIRKGYLSNDGTKMLVSLRVSSSQSITEGAELIAGLEEILSALDYSDEIIVTGFPVLLSSEFTHIIDDLRKGLLAAVLVGIGLIGLATRSLFYAMVAAVPNLFPILFIEAVIYLNGGHINVTQVVALTIAFGIAIDNAVHIINVFEAEKSRGTDLKTSLKTAIVEVGPALGGSTLIICTATTVVLLSTLPLLTAIGQLLIAILIVALITNLIVLPANILTLRRVFDRTK